MEKKATKDNWSYEQFLKELCLCELDHKKEVKTENLLKQSKILPQYTLDGLDQKLLSTKVVRGALTSLLKGEFVSTGSNVLAFGLPGRGKNHLLAYLEES